MDTTPIQQTHRSTTSTRRGFGPAARVGIALLAGTAMLAALPSSAAAAPKRSEDTGSTSPSGTTTVSGDPTLIDDPAITEYREATSLLIEPTVAPIYAGSGSLIGTPTYHEHVTASGDEIIVTRTATFELAPGACDQPGSDPVLVEHCVAIDTTVAIPADLADDLARMRDGLRSVKRSTAVADDADGGTITAREALGYTDHELLDLALNGATRTVRHTTRFVPVSEAERVDDQQAVDDGAGPADPSGPTEMEEQEAQGDTSSSGGVTKPTGPENQVSGPAGFSTRYLMAGMRHERSVGDDWEYTFADSSWWHGRYYVRFWFDFTARFEVRVPFSIDVDHVDGDRNASLVDISVDTVDVDAAGQPAYPAVGLPADDYDDGDEVLFSVDTSCGISASIPGPDPSWDACEEYADIANQHWDRNVVPPLGDEVAALDSWWLESSDTNLELSVDAYVGSAWAGLDLGVEAQVRNARIGYRVQPRPGTELTAVGDDVNWSGSSNPRRIGLVRDEDATTEEGGDNDLGFTITDPRYRFDLALQPLFRLDIGVDVGPYEKSWTPTWRPESISTTQRVDLGRHPGTTGYQTFALHWGEEAVDEPTSDGGTRDYQCCAWSTTEYQAATA